MSLLQLWYFFELILWSLRPPQVKKTHIKNFRESQGGGLGGRFGVIFLGKDQKGLRKRGIHDQGDFWTFLLETTV